MRTLQTSVQDAGTPLFARTPGCALYKQADFATAWMPSGTSIGPHATVNWFTLPGPTNTSAPLLIDGDSAVQFNRNVDTDALMAYLAGPQAGRSWAHAGGLLSPKKSIPDSVYPEQHLTALAAALKNAQTVTFDASDEMPPAIGSGALRTAITDWIAGVDTYPESLRSWTTLRAQAASDDRCGAGRRVQADGRSRADSS